jgi:S-disulfanyl-L-cysteine oxidoreductase SoxD
MPTTDRVQRTSRVAGALLACAAGLGLAGQCAAQTHYGFGRPATQAQVTAWDIDVAPDGRNLPAGSGRVAHGRNVYDAQCAACHGPNGEGGIGDKLAGGQGTLATQAPVKTVGSYWPYATTLFDYIRRAMPLNAPQSLSNEDVYAVSGYVLFLNGLVTENAVVDAGTLTALKMPNRDGFEGDPRPDIRNAGCMRNCAR